MVGNTPSILIKLPRKRAKQHIGFSPVFKDAVKPGIRFTPGFYFLTHLSHIGQQV